MPIKETTTKEMNNIEFLKVSGELVSHIAISLSCLAIIIIILIS
jgi:hypothetical protein